MFQFRSVKYNVYIYPHLNCLEPSSPDLVQFLKTNILLPPATQPYNFSGKQDNFK